MWKVPPGVYSAPRIIFLIKGFNVSTKIIKSKKEISNFMEENIEVVEKNDSTK